ncbi:ATP-binding protein [Azospirillum soli]|uniref:ATP-binding protein n=1 Tax=Azospirillum soli TaxID=1304799 RepID=UPI001AEA0BA3|nr:ATP-binding protein [Azospirillum soli]MBP2311815.1 signal transduction histidine kinase [Azospirillum soli]
MRWRLLPDSLAGRTIAVMVAGLTLSHVASIGAYRLDLLSQFDTSIEHEAVERIAAARSAVLKATPDERERTAHLVSGRRLDVHWSRLPLVETTSPDDPTLLTLRAHLHEATPDQRDRPLQLAFAADPDHPDKAHHMLLVSAQLPDGDWLNLRYILVEPAPSTPHGLLLSTALMAVAVFGLSILLIRSSTAPLRAMARAAERLGVDVTAPPLPETGPSEVRQAAHAFNEMQKCIKRLLADRTQMFAALSHDLRTLLTVLRLRAEFIEDEEQHGRMLADIAEMETMIAATLAFLRDDGVQEETGVIDLAVTLATICDALTDAGGHATYAGARHVPLRCRPTTLKRAFMNLVDNAVKYGARARVVLSASAGRIRVDITDEGPGIPDAEMDQVFQPFYRVERSRNRETGGFGLGLTLARGAIRAHGGDLELANRPEGGLRVTVALPWADH